MAIIFAFYFVFVNAPNIENNVLKQVKTYANYLSTASEYSVLTGNFDIISEQLELICDHPAINKINIYDEKLNQLASEESYSKIEKNFLFSFFYNTLHKEHVTIESSIDIDSIEIYDFDDANASKNQSIGTIEFKLNDEYVFYKKYLSASYGFYITLCIYLFALYSVLRFSRKVSDGIGNIDQTLNDIGSGNLYSRVDQKLVSKFGNIGEGIEKMASAINVSESHLRSEIDRATSKLHSYNQEIIQNNKKLQKAREQADKANTAKTNFLSNISHEIRTPVNGIIGFTELLLASNIKSDYKQYIRNIDDASSQLLHLINDLLDFSRLESGNVKLNISTVDIYDLAAKIHAFYSVNSKNKEGVEIYLNIHPETPQYIFSDDHKLEQVVTNLFSNAIKFTDNGFVRMDISSANIDNNSCDIIIQISDSGIGVDSKHYKTIFNKFEQADMTNSRRYGGSGLGLSIANLLAEKLNGNITVNSEVNKGSTFTFSFSTQFEKKDRAQYYQHIKLGYYDEDSDHKQSLINLLNQTGCTIHGIDLNKLPENHLDILIYAFTEKETAYDFLHSAIFGNLQDKEKVAFFSFYDQNIFSQFESKGFKHISLRTFRLKSLTNLISKPEQTDLKNIPRAENMISAMIIDDNIINVSLLEKYLQKIGVNTISTSCAVNALETLEDLTPDIILTDLHMPKISGTDLAIKVRQIHRRFLKTPIIAITADGSVSSYKKAINSGIQEVLLKPVSFDIIMQKMNKYTNINFIEAKQTTNYKMDDNDIEKMLLSQLPNFLSDINHHFKDNDLASLYQSVHKLVGGLEYCHEHKPLLEIAKFTYDAIQKESTSTKNIEIEVSKLIDKIKETIV